MNKATIAGMAMITALLAVYVFQQSAANAQPPATTRVVTAAPQGEWVVVTQGHDHGNTGQVQRLGDNAFCLCIVMVHTGTGKTRMVKWEINTPGNPNFQVFETP